MLCRLDHLLQSTTVIIRLPLETRGETIYPVEVTSLILLHKCPPVINVFV